MKKIIMSAIATLFLAGTTFAGVTPKVTKAHQDSKKVTKSEQKKSMKTSKPTKKVASTTTKAPTAKPKEETKK